MLFTIQTNASITSPRNPLRAVWQSIKSVFPSRGVLAGGSKLYIDGDNFKLYIYGDNFKVGTVDATVGGKVYGGAMVVSNNHIECTLPLGTLAWCEGCGSDHRKCVGHVLQASVHLQVSVHYRQALVARCRRVWVCLVGVNLKVIEPLCCTVYGEPFISNEHRQWVRSTPSTVHSLENNPKTFRLSSCIYQLSHRFLVADDASAAPLFQSIHS